MRHLFALATATVVTSCGSEEPPPAPPPPPPTYADFAGDWAVVSTLEGVADPVSSQLQNRPDGGGWMMSLEGRDSIPMRASMSGDSLVLLSEPYRSVLRREVTVQVRTASVLADGGIAGRLIATYDYPDSQQVVAGTIRGQRVP
ncbi:MAG TPA: hypothetical protein PLL69_09360 [Gemmatimonadales bacterium]|nr:hypothetical protein [Gemmatimonadales bacterium]